MQTVVPGIFWQVLVALLLVSAPVQADRVASDAGSALVDSRQADFDSPAFRAAWLNALARHTGKTENQLKRSVGSVPANLAKAIERYHFEAVPPQFWPERRPLYWLHVFADKKRLEQIVAENRLPSWPAERPGINTLLLDDTEATPGLATNNDAASAYWLAKRAEQAGLSLHLAKDLPVGTSISETELRQLAPSALDALQASHPDQPVLLLVVTPLEPSRASARTGTEGSNTAEEVQETKEPQVQSQSAPVYQGPVRWKMAYALPGENVQRKKGQATSVDDMARQLTELLRQWHTVRERIYPQERQLHEIPLRITGLHDFSDVKAVSDYLDRLSVVDRHWIEQAAPGRLRLAVRLKVTTDAFLRHIEQGNRFRIAGHQPLTLEKL